MLDPQGQVIDVAIESNLREGLSLTDISFLAAEPTNELLMLLYEQQMLATSCAGLSKYFNRLLYIENIVVPFEVFL